MARKKKGELPSGSIRRQIYDHSEPQFDKNGNPIIDPKTGKQKMKRIYRSICGNLTEQSRFGTYIFRTAEINPYSFITVLDDICLG